MHLGPLYGSTVSDREVGMLVSTIRRVFAYHKKIQQDLQLSTAPVAQACSEKLLSMLQKNPAYEDLCAISDIIGGSRVDMIEGLSTAEVLSFKYSPVTICDVEHSFSELKQVLSDKRRSLTMKHLTWILVTLCNT